MIRIWCVVCFDVASHMKQITRGNSSCKSEFSSVFENASYVETKT